MIKPEIRAHKRQAQKPPGSPQTATAEASRFPPSRTVQTQQSTRSQVAPGPGPRTPDPGFRWYHRLPQTAARRVQQATAPPALFCPAPKRAWERCVLPRAARDDRLRAPGKASAVAAPAPSPPPPSPSPLRLAAAGRTLGPASRERAAMCLFSARHRRGHLTSGRAAAKAVLEPGCVEGVIKGEGVWEEGLRAGPWLRRLKRDSLNGWGGESEGRAEQPSDRHRRQGGDGGRGEGPPSGGGTE